MVLSTFLMMQRIFFGITNDANAPQWICLLDGWYHFSCACNINPSRIIVVVCNCDVRDYSMKTFNHDGGIYTRPDIPSPLMGDWKCHICQKSIDSQSEQYEIQQGVQLIRKLRWIPASRYWHGTIVGIEFCSVDCAFIHYEKEHAPTSS